MLTRQAVVALLVANTSAYKVDPKEVLDIVGGIVNGAIRAEFGDISTCIDDGDKIYNDVSTAVADFEQGSASSVLAGLKEVAASLMDIKTALNDCKAISVKDDLAKLEAMA